MTSDVTTAIETLLDETEDTAATIEDALPDEIDVVAIQTEPTSHDDIAIDIGAPGLEEELNAAFTDLTVDVDVSGTIYVPTEDDA